MPLLTSESRGKTTQYQTQISCSSYPFVSSNNPTCREKALGESQTLQELDVTGHGMRDSGAVALGAALRQNQSVTTLSYDRNSVTLEGFRAIRECVFDNIGLLDVSAPDEDLRVRLKIGLTWQETFGVRKRMNVAVRF